MNFFVQRSELRDLYSRFALAWTLAVFGARW